MSAKGYSSLLLFFGSAGVAVALLAVFFTSPVKIGPIGVTLWFLVLLAAISSLTVAGLFWFKVRSPRIQNTDEKLLQNSWRQGWLLGGAVVAILALSSLHQLTWRDSGIIAGITLLLEVFLRSRP
jgi:hypothetical protein